MNCVQYAVAGEHVERRRYDFPDEGSAVFGIGVTVQVEQLSREGIADDSLAKSKDSMSRSPGVVSITLPGMPNAGSGIVAARVIRSREIGECVSATVPRETDHGGRGGIGLNL